MLADVVAGARPSNLAQMRIPKEMQATVQRNEQARSVQQFVESTTNVGFFEQTDKTFASYLADHPRFFALFYAPFSHECTDFLKGYKEAAASLEEAGYAANFSVRCWSLRDAKN